MTGHLTRGSSTGRPAAAEPAGGGPAAQGARDTATGGTATRDAATPDPATRDAATPDPATRDAATPDPATGEAATPRERRTPGLVALATFLAVATTLLVRNRSLFTLPIHEVGDAAANSLLVNDALRLDLLVGHYSRVGFNHPGPGVLYLQAAGELVFTDLLHLTPAPYNGQVLAVLLLQAGTVAAVTGVLATWHRSLAVAAATLAAATVWFEVHTWSLSSTWIPLLVTAPFLLLLVSAASVAAGHSRHLWLLALSAGLLVHAHVEFALFGPALTAAAVGAWALGTRRGPRDLWRHDPRAWWTALSVAGLFVLPIALNTLLHWPGEVPKYLGYSSGGPAADPTLGDALHYARRFWSPDSPVARYVPVLLVLAAGAAALWAPRPLRRPLVSLTAAAVLAEALFVLYALVGIDDLGQEYVGYFSRAVPLALVLVLVVSLGGRLVADRRAAAALATVSGLVAATAAAGDGFALRSEGMTAVPAVADRVLEAARGRTVVLDVGQGTAAFVDASGLLLELEREDAPVCVATEALRVQVTEERMCSPEEVRTGVVLQLREPGTSPAPDFPGMQGEITVLP